MCAYACLVQCWQTHLGAVSACDGVQKTSHDRVDLFEIKNLYFLYKKFVTLAHKHTFIHTDSQIFTHTHTHTHTYTHTHLAAQVVVAVHLQRRVLLHLVRMIRALNCRLVTSIFAHDVWNCVQGTDTLACKLHAQSNLGQDDVSGG